MRTIMSGQFNWLCPATLNRYWIADWNRTSREMKQARCSLSQETITILTVGVALAGILLVMLGDSRAERARLDATIREMRAEGRAYREAFDKKITRLIEQQGTLNGLVDGL